MKQGGQNFTIALGVLCAVIFFYGLGWLPFMGPDEPRYAQVAREMYGSGDWITPRLGGIHWFEKPALTYWISGAGYVLFGETEFAARFGIALVACLGAYLLFLFGRRIHSPRLGYLCGATLVTCGLWPGFARGATFDLLLSVALEATLLSFFLWEREEEPQGRHRFFYLAALSLGLAVLAKGLVGIVLTGMIVGPYLLLTRRLGILFRPRLLAAGAAIFFTTVSVWYAPVIARNGREFIDEFFIGHHFQRYLTNKYRHPQPAYFFPLVVWLGSFPWSFSLAAAFAQSVRVGRKLLDDRLQLFLLLWAVVPMVFFSFSGSKLPGYILPVFPALAVLAARRLHRWWEAVAPPRWDAIATGALIVLVGAAALIIGGDTLGAAVADVRWMAAITAGIGVIYWGILFWQGGRRATLFLPFGLCIIVIAAAHLIFPALAVRESLQPIAIMATAAARPGERLVFFVNHDHGINFYATGLPLRDTKSELVTLFSSGEIAQLAQASRSRSILVVSKARWIDDVMKARELKTEMLGQQQYHSRCSPGCDWVLLRAQYQE